MVGSIFLLSSPAFGQTNTDPWEFFDVQEFERSNADEPADPQPVYAAAASEIAEYNSANGTNLGVPTNSEIDERVIDGCLNRSGRDYTICINEGLSIVLTAVREGTTVDAQEELAARRDQIAQICNPGGVGVSIDGTLSSINRSFFRLFLETFVGYSSDDASIADADRCAEGQNGLSPVVDCDLTPTRCTNITDNFKQTLGIEGEPLVSFDFAEETRDTYALAAIALLVLGLMWQGVRLIILQKHQGLAVIIRGLIVVALAYAVATPIAFIARNALEAFAGVILENQFSDPQNILEFEDALFDVFVFNTSLSILSPILMGVLLFSGFVIRLMVLLQEVAAIFMVGLIPFAAAGQFTKSTRPWLMRLVRVILVIFAYKPVLASGLLLISQLVLSDEGLGRTLGFIGLALLPFAITAAMRVFAFAGVGGSQENPAADVASDYARLATLAGFRSDEGAFKYTLAPGELPPPSPGAPSRTGAFIGGLASGNPISGLAHVAAGRYYDQRGPNIVGDHHVQSGRPLTVARLQAQGIHGSGLFPFVGGSGGGVSIPGTGGSKPFEGKIEYSPGDPRQGRAIIPQSGGTLTPMGMFTAIEAGTVAGKNLGRSISGESATLDGYDELDWNNPDAVFDAS